MNIGNLLSYRFESPDFIPGGQVSQLYKQSEGKIRIKKGEKACYALFAKTYEKKTGEFDENGDEISKQGRMHKWGPTYNVSQLEGPIDDYIKKLEPRVMNEFEELELIGKIQKVFEAQGLTFQEVAKGQPCYIPALDVIQMPERHRYPNAQAHARTKAHEMGHATGHPTRMNRDQAHKFGSKGYAFEELVAENFSILLGMKTGHAYDPSTHDQHASYLNSWIDALTNDPAAMKDFLLPALSQAYKAYDAVMKQVLAMDIELEQEEKQELSNFQMREEERLRIVNAEPVMPILLPPKKVFNIAR